jgi:cytochrome c553
MKTLIAAVAVLGVLSAVTTPVGAADAEAGKSKATSCTGCHGPEGKGNGPNPAIAGMPEKDFVAALEAYKSGKRQNGVMQAMTQSLSEEDMANLAAYFASLK